METGRERGKRARQSIKGGFIFSVGGRGERGRGSGRGFAACTDHAHTHRGQQRVICTRIGERFRNPREPGET